MVSVHGVRHQAFAITRGALTFDEMTADCEAHGCSFTAAYPSFFHLSDVGVAATTRIERPTSGPGALMSLDAWRRRLHGEG